MLKARLLRLWADHCLCLISVKLIIDKTTNQLLNEISFKNHMKSLNSRCFFPSISSQNLQCLSVPVLRPDCCRDALSHRYAQDGSPLLRKRPDHVREISIKHLKLSKRLMSDHYSQSLKHGSPCVIIAKPKHYGDADHARSLRWPSSRHNEPAMFRARYVRSTCSSRSVDRVAPSRHDAKIKSSADSSSH